MNMTPKEYNRYVARLAKKSPLGKDLLNSFLIGGLICVVGQLILNGYTALELSEQDAAAATSVSLVFLSAVLTALSVYDDLAKIAGAGTLVPITGFANAVVSPAIEFKAEGFVTRHGGQNVHHRRPRHRLRHSRQRSLRRDPRDFRRLDFPLGGKSGIIRL